MPEGKKNQKTEMHSLCATFCLHWSF